MLIDPRTFKGALGANLAFLRAAMDALRAERPGLGAALDADLVAGVLELLVVLRIHPAAAFELVTERRDVGPGESAERVVLVRMGLESDRPDYLQVSVVGGSACVPARDAGVTARVH